MARSSIYKELQTPLVVATYNTPAIDISAYNGASMQLDSNVAAGAGTIQLQGSINGLNWLNLGSAATITNGRAIVEVPTINLGFVRGHIILSAGAGNYDIFVMLKERS